MPRQTADALREGETLSPGEFLISNDGRFRLYLENDGTLVAYGYRPDRAGVDRFWQSPASAGPGASFTLTRIVSNRANFPSAVLYKSNGDMAWFTPAQGYNAFNNGLFVVQNDGNIVHYVFSSTNGHPRVPWGSNTYGRWERNLAVPVDLPVVVIPSQGNIIQAPGVGQVGVLNIGNIDAVIRVEGQTTVVHLPPGIEVSVDSLPAGVLSVVLESYSVPPQAAEGTQLRRLDQDQVGVTIGDGRRLIEVDPSRSSLRLT